MSCHKVLIVAHIESCFPVLFNTALLLRNSGSFELIFMFDSSGYIRALIERDAARCADAGIRVEAGSLGIVTGAPSKNAKKDHALLSILTLFKRLLGKRMELFLRYNLLSQLLYNIATRRSIRRLIKNEQINLLVLGLDLAHYNTAVYIQAAHACGIPAVIITDMMTNPSEFGDLYFNNPQHTLNGLAKRIVGKLYPKWTMDYNGRLLLRLPSAGMVLAKELLGLSPPQPWQIHSGNADAILLESDHIRSAAIKNGLEPKKIFVTGLASHDSMAALLQAPVVHRQALYARLGFQDDLPMLLLALPQDDQPVGMPLPFASYREMIIFLAKELASCRGFNTVICLHPSTPKNTVQHLEDWGVKISEEPTASLIPLCHLYVATMSSTIKWAIACAKPVIVFDYNRQRRDDFRDAKGVISVEAGNEFIDVLHRLVHDSTYYEELCRLQAVSGGSWGELDGQAGDRIVKVFEEMLSSEDRKSSPRRAFTS